MSGLRAAPFRAAQQSRFERLKDQLLKERFQEDWATRFSSELRRAANEAAALAWVTAYPLLFFPVLFEEKAWTALKRAVRQEQVRRASRGLLAV